MFKLNEKYEIIGSNLKCDYIRYSPYEINLINTAISQIHINIPIEDSVTSLLTNYLCLNFDVVQAATKNRYVDIIAIKLINLGPIALFSKYSLATSIGKHFEIISHAHNVSLMYKLIICARVTDDLSIRFDRDRVKRQ